MLKVSNSEPDAILNHLAKLSIPTEILPLSVLRYGDYAWDTPSNGSIGIERKSFHDFIVSYQMGRVHNQIAGCLETYDHAMLLLEGVIDTDGFDSHINTFYRNHGGFRRTSLPVIGNIHGLTKQLLNVQMHIPIIYSSHLTMTAQVIAGLYKHFEIHPLLETIPQTKRVGVVESSISIKEIALLRSIPRLSVRSARSLLKKYGSIDQICDGLKTKEKDMLELDGVGKATIESLKEVLL